MQIEILLHNLTSENQQLTRNTTATLWVIFIVKVKPHDAKVRVGHLSSDLTIRRIRQLLSGDRILMHNLG